MAPGGKGDHGLMYAVVGSSARKPLKNGHIWIIRGQSIALRMWLYGGVVTLLHLRGNISLHYGEACLLAMLAQPASS